MEINLKDKLNSAVSISSKIIKAVLETLIIYAIPFYAGFGMFFLSIGVLETDAIRGMFYTLVITAGSAAILTGKAYKELHECDPE